MQWREPFRIIKTYRKTKKTRTNKKVIQPEKYTFLIKSDFTIYLSNFVVKICRCINFFADSTMKSDFVRVIISILQYTYLEEELMKVNTSDNYFGMQ